jgi:cystathionine beta-lyase
VARSAEGIMSEDFDRGVERKGTASVKWDRLAALFGDDDMLGMWVADMDFASPTVVVEAMRRRLEHPVFGYTYAARSVVKAIVDRMERRFGWRIRPEWVVLTPGMVSTLHTVIRTFTHPGDEIVVQPPVYYPFYRAIRNSGCHAVDNQLVIEAGRYRMDLAGLEAALGDSTAFPVRMSRVRMLVLCSPHNPVGRVWTREELGELGEVCLARDVMIVSDEIHNELVLDGFRHTVTASLSPALEQATITLMSASKTFNLAGLDTSFAIIPREDWRHAFLASHESQDSNIFGLVALEAAFNHGDGYLSRLLEYLNANMAFFINEVERRIPGVSVIRPEATYLAWVDLRALGLDGLALQSFVRGRARLAVDDGYAFGPGGEGFIRVNVACPRRILAEAVDRLARAVSTLAS